MSRKIHSSVWISVVLLISASISYGTLVDWENQVNNFGAMPAATNFTTVSGTAPLLLDVGALSGDRSFEFIVNADIGGLSGAFLGNRQANGNQGLKFEQFSDSGVLGITNFGVVDLYSDDPSPVNTDTHVVFASDGVSGTDMYLNGVNVYTFSGAPLQIFGMQGLAGIAESTGSFTDLLDGNILGSASYDSALSASEVQTHSNAFFCRSGTFGGFSLRTRRRQPLRSETTWASTLGRSYSLVLSG